MPIIVWDHKKAYVQVRCDESEADNVKDTLEASGFTCGPTKAADGFPAHMRMFEVSLNASWNQAAMDRLLEDYPDAQINES